MANGLLAVLTATAGYTKDRFLKQTRQTAAVQEQFLRRVLAAHRDTAIGREYGLGEIKTVAQFCDRLPVRSYPHYEPYIERAARGEPQVMTSDRVVYFSVTSGSTGKQKFIPVTERSQSSLRRANITSIGFLDAGLKARGKSLGRVLLPNTTYLLGYTEGGVPYGTSTAGVLRMGRWVYRQLFSQPYEALQMRDSKSRHYVCLLFALRDRNLCGMAANFPMLILRTCEYLERFAEELIFDLERGTIAPWVALDPPLRAALERRLTPEPARARELRSLLTSEGILVPKTAWPELAYVGTARGGTSDFYFQRFPKYFGDLPVFGAAYASAEATYGIYPDLGTDGSILAIESAFFEFVPESQWEADHPKTVLAEEVKVGDRYRILSTHYNGFYRYDNGDVVEVVGFHERAPLIVFRHRRGGLISSTSEKTTEAHIATVMDGLQQEFGCAIEDYCITLSEVEIPAHYIVNIELISPESAIDLPKFLRCFDERLKRENPNYKTKRNDVVPPPRLHLLAPGSFQIVRQRQLAKGIPDSQLKFPHISEDRQLVAGLEAIAVVHLDENQK